MKGVSVRIVAEETTDHVEWDAYRIGGRHYLRNTCCAHVYRRYCRPALWVLMRRRMSSHDAHAFAR